MSAGTQDGGSRIVVGTIEPIKASKLRFGNIGDAEAVAYGAALRFPTFAKAPALMPGTEARRFDGSVAPGTGVPIPDSVVVTDDTLANARDAAERALAVKSRLTVEGLALATSVLEYAEGRPGNFATRASARATAVQIIATQSRMPVDQPHVDLLNLAYAVIHYGNTEKTS